MSLDLVWPHTERRRPERRHLNGECLRCFTDVGEILRHAESELPAFTEDTKELHEAFVKLKKQVADSPEMTHIANSAMLRTRRLHRRGQGLARLIAALAAALMVGIIIGRYEGGLVEPQYSDRESIIEKCTGDCNDANFGW